MLHVSFQFLQHVIEMNQSNMPQFNFSCIWICLLRMKISIIAFLLLGDLNAYMPESLLCGTISSTRSSPVENCEVLRMTACFERKTVISSSSQTCPALIKALYSESTWTAFLIEHYKILDLQIQHNLSFRNLQLILFHLLIQNDTYFHQFVFCFKT